MDRFPPIMVRPKDMQRVLPPLPPHVPKGQQRPKLQCAPLSFLDYDQIYDVLRIAVERQEEFPSSVITPGQLQAAILLAPDNSTRLMIKCGDSQTRHAVGEIVRDAPDHWSPDFLWQCTLVTIWEPCVMCMGTVYCANIGRVVYGARHDRLRNLLMDLWQWDPDRCSLHLSSNELAEQPPKKVTVIGPIVALEDDIVDRARSWCKERELRAADRENVEEVAS